MPKAHGNKHFIVLNPDKHLLDYLQNDHRTSLDCTEQ